MTTSKKVAAKASPKLNNALIDRLSWYIKQGVKPNDAALLLDINSKTFWRWRKLGREAKTAANLYGMLHNAIESAEAQFKSTAIAVISKAGRGVPRYKLNKQNELILDNKGNPIQIGWQQAPDWRAIAWLLERKYSEFRLTTDISNINANTKNVNNLNVVNVELNADTRRKLRDILEESSKAASMASIPAKDTR
jgi:hypothetical protein